MGCGEGDDPEALVRAATVWKTVAEAEKAEHEFKQLDRSNKSEAVRLWVPVLGAFFGTGALVGTLLFQIWQFNVNEGLQLQAAQDSAYREAVRTIEQHDPQTGIAVGIPLMKMFRVLANTKHKLETS